MHSPFRVLLLDRMELGDYVKSVRVLKPGENQAGRRRARTDMCPRPSADSHGSCLPCTPCSAPVPLNLFLSSGRDQHPATPVPVVVTSARDHACPLNVPPVSVIATPARRFPLKSEPVIVAASATHHVTLQPVPPPAITTWKPVPVSAPVPLVPTLMFQIPSEGPLSVRTPVTTAAASKQ